jgi:hypothetical protein
VVVGGGELDEPLQERPLGSFRLQPDRFPRLVGVPEVAGVELVDAEEQVLSQWRAFPSATPRRSPS